MKRGIHFKLGRFRFHIWASGALFGWSYKTAHHGKSDCGKYHWMTSGTGRYFLAPWNKRQTRSDYGYLDG